MANLIREVAMVSVGSDGLLFLPYLLGERAPIWNASARGCYFGINIKHERSHFIRATVEGILYEIYSIGRSLAEHRTINTLTVNGSFASIPFCAQMIADIFNMPVAIGRNLDTIAHGAFLISAIEMGLYKSVDEAARTVELSTTYKPQMQTHEVYEKYYAVFEKLSTGFFEVFEEIDALQSAQKQ
jgi:gluconokinase